MGRSTDSREHVTCNRLYHLTAQHPRQSEIINKLQARRLTSIIGSVRASFLGFP